MLLAAVDPDLTMVGAGLVLLLFAVAVGVHVVVHEAAHALAGLALGMEVPEVELGEGPTLLRLRMGSTTVRVGGFHSGATHLEPRSSGLLRTRLAVSYAAGPLSNLALAAAAYSLVDLPPGPLATFTRFVIGVGVVLGVLNLAPLKVSSAGGTVRTDGAALLSLLRVGRAAGEQIVAASRLSTAFRQYRAGESLTARPEGLPVDHTDPVILGIEGTRRILTGEYDEALALLREAVSLPQEDDVLALSLNNLAWVLLLTVPDGWLEEADRASEHALSLKPWMEPLMGTRGCVLTHRGELADARHLLQRAVQGDTARQVRLVLYRHLFRAEHGLGNLYGARAALLALADNGAEPEELESVRALLRPWEVDNALANLVGADGVIEWPDARGEGTQARHVVEMRHALTAFVQDAGDDPRLEAVRRALG